MSLIIKNSSEWNSSEILGINDIGIVADSSNEEYAKVGDGKKTWADLPWRTIPKGRQIYLNGRIQFRIIPDDQTSEKPLKGEIGVKPGDRDNTHFFKIGDGIHTWAELPWKTGPQGVQGAQGYQGPRGDRGPIGPQGVSISHVYSSNGSLYVSLSNGRTYSAGYVMGPQGPKGPKGDKGDKGDMPDMSDYYKKDETDAQIAAQIDEETLVITDYSTTTNHYTVAFCNTIANLVGNGKKVSLVRTYTDVASITIKVTLYAYDVYGSSTKNIQFFGWGYYDDKVHLFYERLNTNNRAFLPAFSLIKIIPTGEIPTETEIKSYAKSMLTDNTTTFTDAEQRAAKNKLGLLPFEHVESNELPASIILSNEKTVYATHSPNGDESMGPGIFIGDVINQDFLHTLENGHSCTIRWEYEIYNSEEARFSYDEIHTACIATGDNCENGVFTPSSTKGSHLYEIEVIKSKSSYSNKPLYCAKVIEIRNTADTDYGEMLDFDDIP